MARDHGGNIGAAIARFGGAAADWIDLSTGINRLPYPVGGFDPLLWQRLPMAEDMEDLRSAVLRHYRITAPLTICAGAQAAIQMIPNLRPKGRAAVLAPSYNEHAAQLQAQGWQVTPCHDLAQMQGADLAVVVNPNNPDGRCFSAPDLLALRDQVGLLVVDESFGDVAPHLSMLPHAGTENLIILRSFGKFWGLAGTRIGFVFGAARDMDRLHAWAGPWPVAGPALQIAARAYQDVIWADQTRARLAQEAPKLDALAQAAGWQVVGGCDLFRLYAAPSARAAQEKLAQAHIWSRIFPYSDKWLRLGPPGAAQEWDRLAAALR